jgi:hypothetical protein
VVARDYLGYPFAAASLHIKNCISAEEAEARDILTGLKLGLEHELKVARVESDCAKAVKSTNCLKFQHLWYNTGHQLHEISLIWL